MCAISIIRISLIIPLTNNPGPDFSYSGVATYYWTDVETNLAIVVASSITLKPFISRLLPKSLFGSSNDDNFGAHAGHQLEQVRRSPNRSLFDPIITFGSRLTRRAGSGAPLDAMDSGLGVSDDTKALRSAPSSHASHASSSRLDNYSQSTSGNRTILDRHGNAVDEEMGLSLQHQQHDGNNENDPKPQFQHAVRSMPSDQTLDR